MIGSHCARTLLGIGFASMTAAAANGPALTIYNQNFAVVRQTLPLNLKIGENIVDFADTTAHLEPNSVILRDPTGKRRLQIVEQNFRSDPLSPELLLSLNQGREIEFLLPDNSKIKGRIIRAPYVPHQQAWQRYGRAYMQRQIQMMYNSYGGLSGAATSPIIEVDGTLRFGLPGTPLFPNLGDETILKPTLHWVIETDAAGPLDAELAYVTGGMSWLADYNIIAPPKDETLDLVGWVTIDNQSGREFRNAKIKLMAGDVSKFAPEPGSEFFAMHGRGGGSDMSPPVSEKSFDEYHLYTLERRTTLRDHQTKQVEFVRATDVQSTRLYVYDGALIEHWRYQGWDPDSLRVNPGYGVACNPKVWVMREFENTGKNGLGIPLPAGRVRFYRQDEDGQLEFIGENEIDHTPRDEKIRVYTGNAFDLVGERRRTAFSVDTGERWIDEEFEIKVRNHKSGPAQIRVVEHLYRWQNWELREKSQDFTKRDAHTIEFFVDVPPNEERAVKYKVHYSW